jgi:hypothetical protein
MIRKRSSLLLTLLVSCALWGCPDEDDGGTDASTDSGVREDTGVTTDTGVDTGVRPDTGVDAGSEDSGEDTCLPASNTVDVSGTAVTVDAPTMAPTISGDTAAVLSCRRPEPPEFSNPYCLVECVDFLGYTPTAAEIQQLEVAAFPLFDIGTMTPIDADPTYDRETGIDNDPQNRVPIGFVFTSPQDSECDSGWQLELAFTGGPGMGDQTLLGETPYVIRVRSVQTSTPAWADTYHWGFIRRNDELPAIPACGVNETRVPSVRYTFPIVHRSLLDQAIDSAGAAIPGGDDLDDGLGSGYALVESRDCSSGGGQPMENAGLGIVPAPISDVYLGPDFDLTRTTLYTSETGTWLGIGFEEMTATSSMTLDATTASAITRDGTCVEALTGATFRLFPDALTIFRLSREHALED